MLIPARSDLVWLGAKRATLNRSAGRSLLDHAATSTSGAAQPLIDLNTASAEELQALKGIGPARAAAMGKGRPCKGKDELQRKDIIPPAVYEDIKDQIAARQKGLGGSDDHTGPGVSPSQGQEPQDSPMHCLGDAAAVGQASP